MHCCSDAGEVGEEKDRVVLHLPEFEEQHVGGPMYAFGALPRVCQAHSEEVPHMHATHN